MMMRLTVVRSGGPASSSVNDRKGGALMALLDVRRVLGVCTAATGVLGGLVALETTLFELAALGATE